MTTAVKHAISLKNVLVCKEQNNFIKMKENAFLDPTGFQLTGSMRDNEIARIECCVDYFLNLVLLETNHRKRKKSTSIAIFKIGFNMTLPHMGNSGVVAGEGQRGPRPP